MNSSEKADDRSRPSRLKKRDVGVLDLCALIDVDADDPRLDVER
jgi:hypothetical protein